jgi:hypothetical protein
VAAGKKRISTVLGKGEPSVFSSLGWSITWDRCCVLETVSHPSHKGWSLRENVQPLYIRDLKVEEEAQRICPSASLCLSTVKSRGKCIVIVGNRYRRVVSLTCHPTLPSELIEYSAVSQLI